MDSDGYVTLLDVLPSSDDLLARRSEIVRQLAPLRAAYGGNGYVAERTFKIVEARIATAVRAKLLTDGAKVTEPQIDAGTRTHPEYIAALTADVEQRTRWVLQEEALNEIEHRLSQRRTDGNLLASEARLTPSGHQ